MNVAFPTRLKFYRKESGLTQKELAALLSVSQQAVARWEAGSTEPNISMLQEIAQILNTSINNLIGNGIISQPYIIADEYYSPNDYETIQLPEGYYIVNAHKEDMKLIYPDGSAVLVNDDLLISISSETTSFFKYKLDQLKHDH